MQSIFQILLHKSIKSSLHTQYLHTLVHTVYTAFTRLRSSLAATTQAHLLNILFELLKHNITSKHFLSSIKHFTGFAPTKCNKFITDVLTDK